MTSGNGSSTCEDALAGLRMAFATLTILPTRMGRTDRAAAGWAMALAPLAGGVLGLLAAIVVAVAVAVGVSPLLAAALSVGSVALLTRGLHLDGLADLADGLGSARPAAGALDVMRRSDIGPFGVITVVFVLVIHVLALGELASESVWTGTVGVFIAVAGSRLAITWACIPHVPSARPEGLGSAVAGAVPTWTAAAATAGTLLLAFSGLAHGPGFALGCGLAMVAGLAVASVLLRHAVRRLGGITGDVLGALSEVASATILVGAAIAL